MSIDINFKNKPKILRLDISTKTIGFALFDMTGSKLLELTHFSPKIKPQPEDKIEELIKKADVEASALQKKQTQDAENIQNQIKSTEDVLLEKDQKIKDFKFDDRSLWEKSSTGQKLLLLVGGFLSSASSEGAKAFRDNVQRSIDTDLALQNKKLDSLKESKKLTVLTGLPLLMVVATLLVQALEKEMAFGVFTNV
jgi:hypothetical protein